MTSLAITAEQLVEQCPESLAQIKDTSEVPFLDGIIGQERAVQSIDFGLNMKGTEYNIFVTGLEGTGKSSIVRAMVNEHARDLTPSQDLCMVNNFEDEYCPMVIRMPKGSAVYFSQSMTQFLETLKAVIPEYFKAPEFKQEQGKLAQNYAAQQKSMLDSVQGQAAAVGLGILKTEDGYQVIPMDQDRPMTQEDYDRLDEDKRQALDQASLDVNAKLNEVLAAISDGANQLKAEIKELVASKTELLISEQLDPIRYYFRDCEAIRVYLKQVKEDIINNIAFFLGIKGGQDEQGQDFSRVAGSMAKRYQVNVLVDRRRETGAPVVYEPHPSFSNLFGKIEKKPKAGSFVTDFSMVQAGALLKADNGFLILNIEPLLQNPAVWESLKRTLLNANLRIADMPDQADYGMPSLKPEPIPIKVKVILIGGYEPFRALQHMDINFNKIFKVRADFDYEIKRSEINIDFYARFVSQTCAEEHLLNFTPEAVWQVVRYGSRLVDDRTKMSLQFGRIRAVLLESDYWARSDNSENVDPSHVLKALRQFRSRYNLYEEKMMEQFDDASVLLDVKGRTIGQVNALAVYNMGEIAFGRPTRITAESYMGKPGIINVEHESDLSGQTHDKGVMIIAGFMGRVFARDYPLSVSISITFEQSYDGVDGDSASSTELYAVLSSLSDIPIRQDIAVTGSVNQKGQIQAIGGVNEKIEGFFDVCCRRGLTGSQGVMIPISNVKNLVLKPSVLEAVRENKFHLYQVETIEQGIEILTGIPAGSPGKYNQYPSGTVFGKVQETLARYHKLSLQFKG